mgnify:CR=1 FL=1
MNIPNGFLDYLKICSDIFSIHVDWAFANHSTNYKAAHKALYEKIREQYPKIPSSIIQATRNQALEAVKRLKFKIKPKKKPYSAVRYDARTISLRGNKLSFSSDNGRIKQLITIPSYFKKYKKWKMQSGTIGYDKQKHKLKINLCFQAPDIQLNNENKVVGVDRGIYNIVSLSDGQKLNTKLIRKRKREFLFVKRQLQAKVTKSAKRLLRKRSGKEKRFSLYHNHCISKWLANLPYDTFVLEDLSGIRKQKKGKKINNWLSNWTFYQLELLLTYKAAALGKKVVKVDPSYTSQTCFACGKIDKEQRDKSHYMCSCGYQEHADINAAKNISRKYLFAVEKTQKAEQAEELASLKNEASKVKQPNASEEM